MDSFGAKMDSLGAKMDSGFSFSHDVAAGLSLIHSDSTSNADSNSQPTYSQNLSQNISQNGRSQSDHFHIVPNNQPPNHQPTNVPPLNVQLPQQSIPLAELKRGKYNLPKWTKGLLKTADENLKLKNLVAKSIQNDVIILK